MAIPKFTALPPPYGPGEGIMRVCVSHLKVVAVICWLMPIMYRIVVISRPNSEVSVPVKLFSGIPFRSIVFGQVNVSTRPVLQLMDTTPFSGVNSAISTGIPFDLAYSPLLSAQSFRLLAGDFTTFHATANPANLFFLTVCISSLCPGKAYREKHRSNHYRNNYQCFCSHGTTSFSAVLFI